MLLFRSEEHVNRWSETRGIPRGTVLSLDQCWRLADAEYRSRMDRDWRGMSGAEFRALLDELGLSGPFWEPTG
jgi:hypothetical protein